MDDQLDEALTTEGEEEVTTDTTPVSETEAIEEVEAPAEEAEPTGEGEAEEAETETSEKPKKGFSQRVRELNARAKEAEAKAESLSQRLAELTGSVESREQLSQYRPQVEPGSEISPEQYQADVLRTADSIVALRLKQQEAVNRINSESGEAMKQYPELDPESESFDKELSDAVIEAVEAKVLANPYSASVKSVVDKMMKPYKKAVTNGVGKASEGLAKQVSESALRPTSVQKKEKSAEEKTIEELEEDLGIVQN